MGSKLPIMYWISSGKRRRRSRRLQGLPPPLFWICYEKIVGDHAACMRLDDMDYQPMQEVYNLIPLRQPKRTDRVIRRYNETYFRELVWTLEDRAWQMMMDPDVLRRLFNL